MSTTALRSSYRNCPISEVKSRQPRFRRAAGASTVNGSTSSIRDEEGHISFASTVRWIQNEREKILSFICLICLILSIALFGASFSDSTTLLVSSAGDSMNVASANLGYNQLCFVPQIISDNVTSLLPNACTLSGVDSSCTFTFDPSIQSFMNRYYGHVDSQLPDCTEFNAYRAFHVMAFVLATVAFIFTAIAHFEFKWVKKIGLSHKVKLTALLSGFASGSFGVIAQCLLIDWMNFNQKGLVTFAYGPFHQGTGNTLSTIMLGQTAFYEAGGWVCSLAASILYIAHFPSALAKN